MEKIFQAKKVLLIFAHPDDESFPCAGTIYQLFKKKSHIIEICATRGEAGSTGKPPICLPEELGEVRTAELKCAAKLIGIEKIFFLGLRDGMLINASIKILSTLILPVIIRENPDIIITYISTGISGHDDHICISKAVTKAFRQYRKKHHNTSLYYTTLPQSMVDEMKKNDAVKDIFRNPFKGTPDEKISLKNDIRNELKIKIKALKCHQTQHQDWERFLKRVPLGYLDFEYFKRY